MRPPWLRQACAPRSRRRSASSEMPRGQREPRAEQRRCASAAITQPTNASAAPPPRSARSERPAAAWPRSGEHHRRREHIRAQFADRGPRVQLPLEEARSSSSVPPSTTNATAPAIPISTRPGASRRPRVRSTWNERGQGDEEGGQRDAGGRRRSGSARGRHRRSGRPAPTAPTSTPTSRSRARRAAAAAGRVDATGVRVIETSTRPEAMPAGGEREHERRQRRGEARQQRRDGEAGAAAGHRPRAEALDRPRCEQEHHRIDPTETKHRDAERALRQAGTCWMLAASAAEPPQRSPSEKKPVRVGDAPRGRIGVKHRGEARHGDRLAERPSRARGRRTAARRDALRRRIPRIDVRRDELRPGA